MDPTLRVLAVATLVNTMGNGALLTTSALYFTHVIGLAPTQVGTALAVAAAVALFCQVPLGHLGDARGPREVLVVLTALARVATGGRGVGFKAYLRSVTNVGISVGALLGGLALAVNQPWAYLAVFAL